MVRGDLTKLVRNIMCALITVSVHARDIITSMVKNGVDNSNNFEWVKQMRYYWDLELDNCVVRMSTSQYVYGYEYLGASARLVITPLTVSFSGKNKFWLQSLLVAVSIGKFRVIFLVQLF